MLTTYVVMLNAGNVCECVFLDHAALIEFTIRHDPC